MRNTAFRGDAIVLQASFTFVIFLRIHNVYCNLQVSAYRLKFTQYLHQMYEFFTALFGTFIVCLIWQRVLRPYNDHFKIDSHKIFKQEIVRELEEEHIVEQRAEGI